MKDGLVIRGAEEKDIDRILELLVQVNHVHAAGRPDLFIDGKRKYEKEDLIKMMRNPDRKVFVCTSENHVIGYCMTEMQQSKGGRSETEKKVLYIDDLCVDEKIRKSGAGTALYEYTREYAKRNGCYSMTLHVWNCNPGARAFYDAMGMKPYMTAMETII
jgi:ribosomal protein S18 acetylase RimI-like enzyme